MEIESAKTMTDDISIIIGLINKLHEETEKGFHYVRMVSMRTHAESLIRAINQRIGLPISSGRRDIGRTEKRNTTNMKCPHCDWETPHGIQGIKSHIGKKHKNV